MVNLEDTPAALAYPEPLLDFVHGSPESAASTYEDSAAIRATAPETVSDDFEEPLSVTVPAGYLATGAVIEIIDSDDTPPAERLANEQPEGGPKDEALSEVMNPATEIPLPPTPESRETARNTQLYMENTDYTESLKGHRELEEERCADVVQSVIEDETILAKEGMHTWRVHGSPLLDTSDADNNSMNAWFEGTLPEGAGDIKHYVEDTFADAPEPRGLEVGGTGRSVFGQFPKGFFHRTTAVNLTDTDIADVTVRQLEQHDKAHNHVVVTGNMMAPDVKAEIIAQNDGKKFDFIVQRIYGGQETVPLEPFFVAKQAADYYDMLSDNGIMVAQVMPTHVPMIGAWKAEIDTHYPGLEVQIGYKVHSRFAGQTFTVVRIQKREGAPEHFPVFHARSVIRWQRALRSA